MLTAHLINITGTVSWYKDGGKNSLTDSSDSVHSISDNKIWVKQAGTYTAKVANTKWEDSVTIGVTKDGAKGADAIAISLTNPTMTFNTSTNDEEETCTVLVYEGNTPLKVGENFVDHTPFESLNNGEYAIIYTISDIAYYGGNVVTVLDQAQYTEIPITIYIKTREGISLTEYATVYCTVVKNGDNGTSPFSIDWSN
jgi:hypothetical protein